jgi:RHS repeat-associated protein
MLQDNEGDMYDALYREYHNIQGRWISPDPLGGDITNPQSLNRYAYVMNGPTSFADPSGLACYPKYEGDCDTIGINPDWYISGVNVFGFGWNEFDLLNIPVWAIGAGLTDEGALQDYEVGNGWFLFEPGGLEPLPLAGLGGLLASLLPQTQQAPNPCTQTILSAANNQFGTNFTANDVIQTFTPTGGATNLIISGTGLPAAQFNSLQPGRYALSPVTWLTGYGATLHITAQNYFNPFPATFQNGNIGGATSVLFTAHIDYGFLFNPIGALYHLFREVLHIGGPRKPC